MTFYCPSCGVCWTRAADVRPVQQISTGAKFILGSAQPPMTTPRYVCPDCGRN